MSVIAVLWGIDVATFLTIKWFYRYKIWDHNITKLLTNWKSISFPFYKILIVATKIISLDNH